MKGLVVSCLFLIGCASVKPVKTFHYVTENNVTLEADLYLPTASPSSYPVVILVHGGSWSSRDRSDMENIAEKLSYRGYAVINTEYRKLPEYTYPAPVKDIDYLLKWIKHHSPQYRLDIQRVNFWGYSAGSQISALAALTTSEVKAKAIINGAGPMDFTLYPNDEKILNYLGGNSSLLKEASPVFAVTPSSPPVFTYHSYNDKIVNYSHAKSFEKELNKNYVPNEIYNVPLLGHILTFLMSRKSINQSIDFLDKYNK